jgi:hypothetical protein
LAVRVTSSGDLEVRINEAGHVGTTVPVMATRARALAYSDWSEVFVIAA